MILGLYAFGRVQAADRDVGVIRLSVEAKSQRRPTVPAERPLRFRARCEAPRLTRQPHDVVGLKCRPCDQRRSRSAATHRAVADAGLSGRAGDTITNPAAQAATLEDLAARLHSRHGSLLLGGA